MEKFFELAINLVKNDEAIILIVLIFAFTVLFISISKRKKINNSFSENVGGELNVKASESGADISNSGNNNRDSKINIEL